MNTGSPAENGPRKRNYRGGGRRAPNLGRARNLRHEQTDAEARVWQVLRAGQIEGLKFRRQHPFGPFILDFFCPELKLAVELDGDQHGTVEGMAADARRSAYLAKMSVKVLRFSNHEALSNTEGLVLAVIESAGISLDSD